MNLKKYIFFCLFLFNAFLFLCIGQGENSQLKKLDSVAFNSLEKNSTSVLEDANELLEASLKIKPSFYRVNAYTLLGIINKNRGFYVTSLDFYLKALNSAELLDDQPRISACLNNIGSVYKLQGNYIKAIDYFNRSLEIEKKLNQPLAKSIRYYNLGECYMDIDNLDLSLTYFNNSLLIEQRNQNKEGIIYAELGIADIYIRINHIVDAKIVLEKIEKNIQSDQIEQLIILHKLRGKLFNSIGESALAYEQFASAEALSLKHNIRTNLLELIKLQINYFEAKGEWQRATMKYKEYVLLNDKMNSADVKNKLDDLAYRNEIAKKQLEIELVQEERDLAIKNELLQKDLRFYEQKLIWFVVILLIVSIAFIVFGVKKLIKTQE